MLSSKSIGNKITTARNNANLSQSELAQQVSISPQAVGKWERGESMPDITTFNRLAKILRVDLNYFSEDFLSTTSRNAINESGANTKKNIDKSKLSWDMSSANWVDADFSGLKNLNEKFSNSNMQRCKFVASDLSDIQLKGNNIEKCDFSKSEIKASYIENSQVIHNNFQSCDLQDSEFSRSHIKSCNFSKADLSGVKIYSSTFQDINVTETVLKHTAFIETYLDDIFFEGEVNGCYFDNCRFKKVTFQNALLTNTFFKGRKLKGIKFIDCEADKMTYEFLKNGKADLAGITLLPKTK